jgi:hypothetical protein
VIEFPRPEIKAFLIGLISDAIFKITSEHHLITIHKIEHRIIKRWLKSLLIYSIKEYLFVSRHLYSCIALDVVDEATKGNGIEMRPVSLARFFVFNNFEE